MILKAFKMVDSRLL